MIPDECPESPPPAIGHNKPPEPVELMRVAMPEALERFKARRTEIIASATRKQVTDRVSAAEAGDIIGIAYQVEQLVEAERREHTEPHRNAWTLGKAIADEFWEPVAEAIATLRGRLKAWNDAEDQRIADQEREQNEFMARMRQGAVKITEDHCDGPAATPREHIDYSAPASRPAPAPSTVPGMHKPRKKKIVGDLGAVVTTVDVVDYNITDIRQLPDLILNSPTVHAAVKQVIKSMSRHLPAEIPGVEKTSSSDIRVKS